MSILQEYEEIRKEIGKDKYDAIEIYLNEVCSKEKKENYMREVIGLNGMHPDEWLEQRKAIEKKYNIITLSDVLYVRKEWEKFDKWYEQNKDKAKEKLNKKQKERGAR